MSVVYPPPPEPSPNDPQFPAPGLPPADAPPVNVDVPSVSGPDGTTTATVGQTLTCTMGNWEGEPASALYAYSWHSDGTPNSATGDTYAVVPGDAGHSITCVVTATNSAGSTDAPPSNAVAVGPPTGRVA